MYNKKIMEMIGCGYCYKEKDCKIHDPKINKAKLGCKEFINFAYYESIYLMKLDNQNKENK